MASSARQRKFLVLAIAYGLLPCIVGAGFGQYLRWKGYIWLTVGGAFWPVFCILISLFACLYLALTKVDDKTLRVSAWILLTWTWLYAPFWLTAIEVPRSSAIVGSDGQVTQVNALTRTDNTNAWLFAGRSGNKIIRNVEGSARLHSVDFKYRFSEAFIASRRDDEDLSSLIVEVMNAALAAEIEKPKRTRVALYDPKDVPARFLAEVCNNITHGKGECPLTMTLTPTPAAMLPGEPWSKQYSEKEAIDELHLPSLIKFLTQESLRISHKNQVFALFMKLATNGVELATVAQTPSLLDDAQFGALIDRIIATPGAGNEALNIFMSVSRLSDAQSQAMRAKAFKEADVAYIIRQYGAGRINDTELDMLSQRLLLEIEAKPDVAILALQALGPRLSRDVQEAAVASVIKAPAVDSLTALKSLNFSNPLRSKLLQRAVAGTTRKDLEDKLPHQRIEELLTPPETRMLVASVMKNIGSRDWLDFAVKVLPVRAMIAEERKAIVDELMFASTKSALEFVSENRQYIDPGDVLDVTKSYTRTVAPDFCLHLTHRNASRQTEYFSGAQISIFRACAGER